MGAGGRPSIFKSAEEIQTKIDSYFESCQGTMLKNDEGEPVLNKYGEPIYIDRKPYTVTGLALYLGFNSRQALLNYQEREEFNDTILRAKARIEEYAETRLYDKDGCNGAKFNLSNNFGWKERQEVESTNTNVNLNKDITALTDAELEEELEKLK